MSNQSIFKFKKASEFLTSKDLLNPNVSGTTLSKMSKKFGYKSPRSLSAVLKGQRLPSARLVDQLSAHLNLTANEQKFFLLLVNCERRLRMDPLSSNQIFSEIENAKPCEFATPLENDEEFKRVATWRTQAIRELVVSNQFVESTDWIFKKFRRRISRQQIECSLKALENQKLIERSENGTLHIAESHFKHGGTKTSKVIQEFHKQQLIRAAEILETQNIDERDFKALTFLVDKKRIPELKRRFSDFMVHTIKEFHDEGNTDVGQLNLQFFTHTDSIDET